MMADLMVEKKNGQVEPFDRSKILSGLVKSGATPEQAETITAQVENWSLTVAVNNTVKTSAVRSKVLEFLRGVNPNTAAAFEAYQKPTP